LEKADTPVLQIDETFPSTDNIKNLVIQEAKVPKILNFPETMRKYVPLLDAENLIYVFVGPWNERQNLGFFKTSDF